MIPESWVEKPPPPLPLAPPHPSPPPFLSFHERPASVMSVEYPRSLYYKSTLRFLLSEYPL